MPDKERLIGIMIIILTSTATVLFISLLDTQNDDTSLCERYSQLDQVNVKYLDGEKYIDFGNALVREEIVKQDCLDTKNI